VAALVLGCFVVAGVQSSIVAGLKRDNAGLRAKAGNLDQLRAANDDVKRWQAQSQELERLRRDNAELAQLRVEAAQLRDQVQDAENLRAEALKRMAASAAQIAMPSEDSFLSSAFAEAQRANCANRLKQIGLATRIWGSDHDDLCPTNYLSMSNELDNPKLLVCPGDKAHTVAADWGSLTDENMSYPIISPGISQKFPAAVYAYCPIHHIYLMVDGSVQVLTPEQEKTQIKVVNGMTTYVP
jgi:hypothetical protein